jgi:hypothetical protein
MRSCSTVYVALYLYISVCIIACMLTCLCALYCVRSTVSHSHFVRAVRAQLLDITGGASIPCPIDRTLNIFNWSLCIHYVNQFMLITGVSPHKLSPRSWRLASLLRDAFSFPSSCSLRRRRMLLLMRLEVRQEELLPCLKGEPILTGRALSDIWM